MRDKPFPDAREGGNDDRFDLILRASSDGFWDWHHDGIETMWWSEVLYSLLGLGPGEVEPSWERLLALRHPDDVARWDNQWKQMQYGHPSFTIEVRLRAGGGGYTWFAARARGEFDEAGHMCRMVGALSDISAQKQAEQLLRGLNEQLERRVEERTAELSRANARLRRSTQQLEEHNNYLRDFAAFASHDLREPLRKIRAYGDLLHEEVGEFLNDDARDYLGRMLNAAERMERLIDDLLRYSRSTGQDVRSGVVDLNVVLQNVLGDLEVAFDEAGATVDAGRLPKVVGTQSQLRQVLQNLLANAVKYRKKDEPCHIRITADELELCPLLEGVAGTGGDVRKYYRFSVQDNGIGFDQRYADRIFQPFKRLNSRHEYSGSGIGLAVCRRVVERHDGLIYAESFPGEGTQMHVLLPVPSDPISPSPNEQLSAGPTPDR